jgi:glycosyltransferase involved in cell wall biosynthesis
MLVSVVITTKNEQICIEDCLTSVENQDFPRGEMEIIVIDNNSIDNTKEIARGYTEKVFNIGPERSAQRNFGAKKSSGEYILYLDADMVLSRDVIKDCLEKMKSDKNLVGLYISEKINGQGFWGKVRNFERSFYDGTVIDAVRFVKKGIFLEVGGFDENLTGPEDWDFDKKIRSAGKVELVKMPIYHNEQNFSLKKYLKRKKYYARDFEKYIAKWGKNDPDIKRQFGFCYRFFGVFTENGKWKILIRHPVLTTGMYFLRFLVGVNYLKVRL